MRNRYKVNDADFEEIRVPCPDGRRYRMEYRYVGPRSFWMASGETLRRYRIRASAALAAAWGLYGAALACPAACNRMIIVGMPSLLAVIPLLYAAMGQVQMCRKAEALPAAQFRRMRERILAGSMGAVLLLGIAGAACIAGSFPKTGENGIPASLLYFCSAFLCLAVWKFFRTLPYQTIQPDTTAEDHQKE